MATHTQSIWNPQIVQRALGDSFRKLHPRTMAKNPVMFVVEVGSVLTTLRLVYDATRGSGGLGFELQITLWLWATVLFASFAEAMAEGRGKAQADTLRRAKTETVASRERPDGTCEVVPAPALRKGHNSGEFTRQRATFRRTGFPFPRAHGVARGMRGVRRIIGAHLATRARIDRLSPGYPRLLAGT